MRKINLFFKRLVDIIGSLSGIIFLFPLFIITAIFIKITMPGPIFFIQERVGKDMKVFKIFKFRTMKVDEEAERLFDWSKDEERLTKTGIILRRLKIDELPQLLNVFRGDMSLVGPRPTVEEQAKKYTKHQMIRLRMRPGMTGLAQINGNTSLPWDSRIEYDVDYIKVFSIVLDFKILIKTIAIVIFGEEKFRKDIIN
jgi:lipopolysaccharide/colanic/teichoic acid biosynthesis glycosyltransferase